jgi:hypothetical protein
MATPSTANCPTQERISALVNGFQNKAQKTGIGLDVFTAIGEAANTPPLLAAKTSASERGSRILCDYLTIMGLVTKENGRYGLTDESALFLKRPSPASLVAMTGFLGGTWEKKNTEALTDAVRKDGTVRAQAV